MFIGSSQASQNLKIWGGKGTAENEEMIKSRYPIYAMFISNDKTRHVDTGFAVKIALNPLKLGYWSPKTSFQPYFAG